MAMIDGPYRFRFVGFWAMSPTSKTDGYPSQAADLIGRLPSDGLPTWITGDFNASYRNAQHLRNVERLQELGLVSAYDADRALAHHAREPDPTSFHQWQQDQLYHMDYLFVRERWTISEVTIGAFGEYALPGGVSDHMPIVATIRRA